MLARALAEALDSEIQARHVSGSLGFEPTGGVEKTTLILLGVRNADPALPLVVRFKGVGDNRTGQGAWAFVVERGVSIEYSTSGPVLHLLEIHKPLTALVAEYTACIEALKWLCDRRPKKKVAIYGTHPLVVKQLNGKAACTKEPLIELHKEALRLRELLPKKGTFELARDGWSKEVERLARREYEKWAAEAEPEAAGADRRGAENV